MTKSVQFNVEVKNLEITSGSYEIQGITKNYIGAAVGKSTFQGASFSASLKLDESEYFAVTVWIESYTHNGKSYSVSGNPVCMIATLRLSVVDEVVVSPESTIATAYSFARFINVESNGLVTMSGTKRNMKIAYGMKQNFYRTEGKLSERIQTSPNGFETNSFPMFNSLCNLFYYSITDAEFYNQFLNLAWHPDGEPNNSFVAAIRNILHDPFHNAKSIYDLVATKNEVYQNSLVSMNVADSQKAPDQWTLTFKTNTSGSLNFIPSGTAFAVFDANDRVWVANNFRAGSGASGTHCLVYNHDASPAPFSPVQGGGVLGVGFGAAIDPSKKVISFGNFGWDSVFNNPQEGSISQFHFDDGTPISPSNGFTQGLSRVQGMEYDSDGNLWMASVGCQDPFAPAPVGVYDFDSKPSAVVVYRNGDPTQMVKCDEFPIKSSEKTGVRTKKTPYLKVFDVKPDNNGYAYVSCIGNYDENNIENCAFSAVYRVKLEETKIEVENSWFSDHVSNNTGQTGYESLRQVTIDPNGNVIVVGVTSSRATVLSPDLSEVLGYYDTNTNAPWGVKIDQKGTVFLANFGHDTGDRKAGNTLDLDAPFGVTLLRDPSNPASAKLMTVPTGGDEVTLANTFPLYGSQTYPEIVDGKPTGKKVQMHCYSPIMRLTSTTIDGAGNLWCMNNWKPSALVDVADNPGGDGCVIYLGIAEPE